MKEPPTIKKGEQWIEAFGPVERQAKARRTIHYIKKQAP
jgi:hypothetical protein